MECVAERAEIVFVELLVRVAVGGEGEYAQEHADASGLLNPSHPLLPVFFSIDFEQEVRLEELDDRLDDLEETLESLQARQARSGEE